MPRGELLGSLEHVVLLAVLRLGADAYGVTVRREIADRTDRDISLGATYSTLDRLERKGYVKSKTGEPTAERGGRAKRHFEITPAGVAAIRVSQAAIERMASGLKRAWSSS